MIRAIHHVGIAVQSLATAYRFYRDVLGLPLIKEAEIADQGVRAALLAAGDSEVELLEPIGANSGMGKFIARHGEGLHHVCFDTPDVAAELVAAKEKGAHLIDTAPRVGLAGRIGFLHPRSCASVLVELATPFEAAGGADESLVRLKRVVIGSKEPRDTAALFQRYFEFPEIAINGGTRVMLRVGRGALLIVPAEEVGGTEGMVAISMVADAFDGLTASLEAAGTRGVLRGTGEVTLEPVASHGVHLHISRYE